MAINQVLVEGALLGDPRSTIDEGHHAHFELLDDAGHIFRCRMWLGNECHCRAGDRVLAIGHLEKKDGEFVIEVISLRKLARDPRRLIEVVRDTPEPVPGPDEIPI
jgi:hypothetical protein